MSSKLYLPFSIDDDDNLHPDKIETMIDVCPTLEDAHMALLKYLHENLHSLFWLERDSFEEDLCEMTYKYEENYSEDKIKTIVQKIESISDRSSLKLLVADFAKDITKKEDQDYFSNYILDRAELKRVLKENKPISKETFEGCFEKYVDRCGGYADGYWYYEIREHPNPLFPELKELKTKMKSMQQENQALKEKLLQEQLRPPERGGSIYEESKKEFESKMKK